MPYKISCQYEPSLELAADFQSWCVLARLSAKPLAKAVTYNL
ncbi:hypothetical protein B0O79_3187 [Flavobacteriaceae bacterium MAR_2009_75]|nr:hypothetical protein B0O79_3187 [Flavobacteriaceae bacterium MAR_2009_75]